MTVEAIHGKGANLTQMMCPICSSTDISLLAEEPHQCICCYCKIRGHIDKFTNTSQAKVVMNLFAPVPENMIFGPNGDNYGKNPHNPYNKDEEVIANGGTQFSTGAVRSADKNHVMYHLICPIGMRRMAETMKEGFDKYGAYNWERGMPIGDLLNHAIAHIYAFLSGVPSVDIKTGKVEDDLAHAAWNLFAAMRMEETHPELDHQLRPTHPLNNPKLELDEKQSITTPDNQTTT